MNLTEQVARINELNSFLLKEQISTLTSNKPSGSNIIIQGPYEWRLSDDKVVTIPSGHTITRGTTFRVIYQFFNNSSEPVKIKEYKVTGSSNIQSNFSNPIIAPGDYQTLTVKIKPIETKFYQPEKVGLNPNVDVFSSTPKKEVKLNEVISTTISGSAVITPNLQQQSKPSFGLASLTSSSNDIYKTLPSFTVNVSNTNVPIPIKKINPVTSTIDWVKTWNAHDWLTFGELAATAVALLTPVGWVALAASATALAFGGANAILYFQEGDNYMGGLIVFFSLIPGATLTKNFISLSKNGVKETFAAIRAVKAGTASEAQKKIASEFAEELGKKATIANDLLENAIKKNFLDRLAEQPLKTIVGSLVKLGKFVGVGVVVIGGMTLTWDTIYGLLGKNEDEIQDKSPVRAAWKLINEPTNQPMIKEEALKAVKGVLPTMTSKQLQEIVVDTTAGANELKFEDEKYLKDKEPLPQ